MASEPEVEMVKMVRDMIFPALDQLTTAALDMLADLPRTTDGQIRDDYWRGILDGTIATTDALRTTIDQTVQEISEH